MPHRSILHKAGCVALENLIQRNQLRWIGYLGRMPDTRLTKQLLYSEFTEGTRVAGVQEKQYKDSIKNTLEACQIRSPFLEALLKDLVV